MSTPALAASYAAVHASAKLAGPGDARPTALQIVKDEQLVDKLPGKVILVTGCSSGIGVETARALHATGADVYITVRDAKKGAEVVADIKSTNAQHKGKLELVELELGSLASVRTAAADFLARSGGKLHVLVCNAGVMACPYTQTKDGFEQQFGVNHLAHFLLFQLLKSALLSSASAEFPSRVVSLASSGHQCATGINVDDTSFGHGATYSPWAGYGQAKTANIWFANELERRYGAQHLHATSVMPGGIWTPLQRHIDEATMAQWKSPEVAPFMKSTQQGAATSVWAAVGAAWKSKGGRYLEDCREATPLVGEPKMLAGYAPHAYNTEGEKALWQKSLELTGTKE